MSDTRAALAAYELPEVRDVAPIPGGLINHTFCVTTAGGRYVLQSLHRVFKPSVHEDIEAITAHLEKKGLATPRLVRTREGALYTTGADGTVWRLMTFVDGEAFAQMQSPARARAAGDLVGRFHVAVSDLRHDFHFTRPGAHDTAKHMEALRTALVTHARHRHYDKIAPVAEAILRAYETLSPLEGAPRRIVHGDLKTSNLLFSRENGAGLCLVDLDTMAMSTIAIEMGDALRSWCNPLGEDTADARFDLDLFGSAVEGYLARAAPMLTPSEFALLVPGVLTIALELAARFGADALNENYFGFDSARFADRSTHNLVRAAGQYHLFESLAAQRQAAEATVLRLQRSVQR